MRPPTALRRTRACPLTGSRRRARLQSQTPMNAPQLQRGVFLALLAAVTAAFVWVLLPFFGAVLWGVALAILFTPLYKWLLKKMRGKPNAAALSTLAICLFIVILPLAMVG